MAGETILRSEIELNIAKYLDRAGDPVVVDIVGTWFSMAHRKAQRQFNFSIMEDSDIVVPIEGGNIYNASPLMKEPLDAALTETTGSDTKVLRRYDKKDHDTILRYADDGNYQGAVFCLDNRTYMLWPPTKNISPTQLFEVRGYMFVATPPTTGHDWFTDFGSDFLLYQALVESVDYVSAPEGRAITWQARANEAMTDLIYMDTQFKISGLMSVR